LSSSRRPDAGIPLALARVHGPAAEMLERTGVVQAIWHDGMGGRVEDAVRALE